MDDVIDGPAPLVILGHGASGTSASMATWIEGLRLRGLSARAIDLPKGKAERAVPVFAGAIGAESAVVPGGHSFGGRVASLAVAELLAGADVRRGTGREHVAETGRETAAERAREGGGDTPAILGLLLLSYPLHRPGAPETWRERTAHWPRLGLPVLLLSGESDPFARIELLREAVRQLPDGRLHTYPGVGHGLAPVLENALDRAAEFIRKLRA